MAELREAHLCYLLAIYEWGGNDPQVGIQAVAKALNCSKASVTKMMGILMNIGLLARERLPAMKFDLTAEETADLVKAIVVNLL